MPALALLAPSPPPLSFRQWRSRQALQAASSHRCVSRPSHSRRGKGSLPSLVRASNPSFERTAYGSRSIPTLGAPMHSSQTSVLFASAGSARAVTTACAAHLVALSPCVANRLATSRCIESVARPPSPASRHLTSAYIGCVFRKSVTGRFGIVTAEFGSVTDHFGDVTDDVLMAA